MSDSWVPPEADPRSQGSQGSPVGEKATLVEYLSNYRLTLRMKCDDLSPAQLATRAVPPSTLSLLGLVRHLAYVEHTWFRRALQGRLDEPRPFTHPDDRDFEFTAAVGTAACAAEAFAEWEQQMALADEWLETLAEDGLGDQVVYNSDGDVTSVRDILVHLVEEYARHCGHADLLRECLDGRTGQ